MKIISDGWATVLPTYAILAYESSSYDHCGCVDPYEWSARYFISPDGSRVIEAPLCNRTDPCFLEANQQFVVDATLWSTYCAECALACVWTTYVSKLSSFSAPPKWRMNRIKGYVESWTVPLPVNWSSTWQSDIVSSYVALDVFTADYRVDNYSETAAITGVDVMSNVGGHTGLWIGISFLSVMELVEMLYRLLRYYCRRLRRVAQKRGQSPDQWHLHLLTAIHEHRFLDQPFSINCHRILSLFLQTKEKCIYMFGKEAKERSSYE